MVDQFRRMNIIDCDSDRSKKTRLSVVVAVTSVDISDGSSVLLRISDAAYNPNLMHYLLSKFELQEKGCKINSKVKRHEGLQKFWSTGKKDFFILY